MTMLTRISARDSAFDSVLSIRMRGAPPLRIHYKGSSRPRGCGETRCSLVHAVANHLIMTAADIPMCLIIPRSRMCESPGVDIAVETSRGFCLSPHAGVTVQRQFDNPGAVPKWQHVVLSYLTVFARNRHRAGKVVHDTSLYVSPSAPKRQACHNEIEISPLSHGRRPW